MVRFLFPYINSMVCVGLFGGRLPLPVLGHVDGSFARSFDRPFALIIVVVDTRHQWSTMLAYV